MQSGIASSAQQQWPYSGGIASGGSIGQANQIGVPKKFNFCPECGLKREPEWSFCPKDGTKLSAPVWGIL